MRTFARHALEIRQSIQSEIHFSGRAAVLVPPYFVEEIVGDVSLVNKIDKSVLGINAGRDDVSVDLVAVAENYSFRLSPFDQNLCGGGLRADLYPRFAGGVSNRIRDSAGATAGKSPGPEGSVDFAHVVM